MPVNNELVNGPNGKAKTGIRRVYGYRTLDTLHLTLLHKLGHLPEAQFSLHIFLGSSHKFAGDFSSDLKGKNSLKG
jgi:hypothetical protein